MLLIWDVTSATDAKNYYASSVSPGGDASRQDYYSEGQESPAGSAASSRERLGLKRQGRRQGDLRPPLRQSAPDRRTNR